MQFGYRKTPKIGSMQLSQRCDIHGLPLGHTNVDMLTIGIFVIYCYVDVPIRLIFIME